MKYIFALVVVLVGAFLVIKTEWFVDNFGTSSWAEAKGIGTRFLYKVVGIAMIVLLLLGISGILGNILLAVFGPLFGGFGS